MIPRVGLRYWCEAADVALCDSQWLHDLSAERVDLLRPNQAADYLHDGVPLCG